MSNNLILNLHHYTTPKVRETLIQKQVLIPTVTACKTCSWPICSANELEILLPNITASLTFSSHLQLADRNSEPPEALVGQLT